MTHQKHNEFEEKINTISDRAHVKWLCKCKTVVINGNEMTVLPYGYFQTAIKELLREAIREAREDTIINILGLYYAVVKDLYGEEIAKLIQSRVNKS